MSIKRTYLALSINNLNIHIMTTVKMQCRDSKGNVIAYVNDISLVKLPEVSIEDFIKIQRETWELLYDGIKFMISVHFIY